MKSIVRIRWFLLLLAAFLAFPAAARAEEVIELLDGTTIRGDIQSVQASKIVLKSRPAGTLLEIPLTYLSPLQQYRARSWRLKPGDLDPTDPNIRMQLAKWCFEHSGWDEQIKEGWDERLKDKAKTEFDKAIEHGGDEFREQIKAYLLDHNIMVDDNGKWMSAQKWHEAQGHVRDPDTGEWTTKEEMDKRQAARLKELKTKLLIPSPNDYTRMYLPVLETIRSRYVDRDKTDKIRKIRFWAHFLAAESDFKPKQAKSIPPVTEDRYARFVVTDEDCADLYIEKKKHGGDVVKKLELFQRGDRVQVFGRMYVTEKGFLILVDDVVAQ